VMSDIMSDARIEEVDRPALKNRNGTSVACSQTSFPRAARSRTQVQSIGAGRMITMEKYARKRAEAAAREARLRGEDEERAYHETFERGLEEYGEMDPEDLDDE